MSQATFSKEDAVAMRPSSAAGHLLPTCGRLAPTPSGEAHLGTLLSALLAWCDVRCRGGRLVLRLDDLDRARCRPAFARQIAEALAWLGLDWDAELAQSSRVLAYARALDTLAAMGRLYACHCPRSRLRQLAVGNWRASVWPVRARLADLWCDPRAPDGRAEAHNPARAPGDPVVRRADQTVAYLLASVLDDAALGVTDVVRGADLAPLTATQLALGRLLGLPEPRYRHHFLLRRADGHKLAKRRGEPSAMRAAGASGARALCGRLAFLAGLAPTPSPTSPTELVPAFGWARVRTADCWVPAD